MFTFTDKLATNKFIKGLINDCTYIMLHHTGGGSYKGNCRVLSGNACKELDVSCHFVIGPEGESAKIGDPRNCLRHAGVGKWNGITQMNEHALGIEVVGPGFTKQQVDKVNELVKHLMTTFCIPADHVIRHKDYAPTRKVDIDDSFYTMQGFKSFKEYQDFISK